MVGDAYRGMASLFVFPSFPEQNRSACCASAELSSVGDYCCRNLCLCLMIVFENRFSAIISQTQTICDCNRLPSLCSRLLPPFDSVVVEGNVFFQFSVLILLRRLFTAPPRHSMQAHSALGLIAAFRFPFISPTTCRG